MSEPIKLVVRRGALRRFDALNRKAAHLQVEVIWDRRQRARRRSDAAPATERRIQERRTQERRQSLPFTWNVADFTVVVPRRTAK
jgi:hypothetical protein